jgi:hypothetical protein
MKKNQKFFPCDFFNQAEDKGILSTRLKKNPSSNLEEDKVIYSNLSSRSQSLKSN